MLRRDYIPDKTILQKLNQRLMRTGLGSRTRVNATIRNGQVTLSGNIQYENQRRVVLRATNSVEGVRTVTDQLRVLPTDAKRKFP